MRASSDAAVKNGVVGIDGIHVMLFDGAVEGSKLQRLRRHVVRGCGEVWAYNPLVTKRTKGANRVVNGMRGEAFKGVSVTSVLSITQMQHLLVRLSKAKFIGCSWLIMRRTILP